MTDEEGDVLSALVLMQEPGEYMYMYAQNLKAGLGFESRSWVCAEMGAVMGAAYPKVSVYKASKIR